MGERIINNLRQGLETAFVNLNIPSDVKYQAQFVSNNYNEGRKVISSIEEELLNCDEFIISVAFINKGGITPLLQTFELLEKRNIKGKILTTDYLNFSEPEAIEKLNEFSNIEIKMYCATESEGFHTKGYIFRKNEVYTVILGSSNMTRAALTINKEWNSRLVSTMHGEYIIQLNDEFSKLWNSNKSKAFDEFIENYKIRYELSKKQRDIIRNEVIPDMDAYRLNPNSMQVEVIKNLKEMVEKGERRSLLISATGTGKTYASAFALRELSPKKILFLVHREQIAKQAITSYKKVFSSGKEFGLLSGNQKDYKAEYLFSTMQMMAKDDVLTSFQADEFDVIVIDEVHRAGASSYQKIIDYFEPKLLFGMTASPDRTDGFDIYNLFDHNIVYEIRLQQALEEDLLCPFHYFGITELEIDGEVFDDNTGVRNFNYLVSEQRVNYIIEKAKLYGYSGDRVKGLIFCSSKKEAYELSSMFNLRGYKTATLSGDDSQEKREEYINLLTSDDSNEYLEYIFTVDIFNEGVDIPSINQVIMLRPTESPIIFIQQLGRGLRKFENKEYVVILDFIGNYSNNFMIPIALSGDRSYNKDTVRKYVREGTKMLPGSSTIHFDEISKKRIFQSIDNANFTDVKLIKESYDQLKFKLGRVPNLMDFETYESIDILRIFDNKTYGSYHKFLSKYEKDYTTEFSKKQENVLEYISKKFASGKRVHELIAIKRLINYEQKLMKYMRSVLKDDYNLELKQESEINLVNVLTNEFATGTGRGTYSDCIFIKRNEDDYTISDEFTDMLHDTEFLNQVNEVIDYGLYRNKKDYSNTYMNTAFQLYRKYTYDDVCRLLEWEKGEVALNIGGYKYDKSTKTYPVFINYDKGEEISETIKYEDRLLSANTLIAISKSGRSIESEDVKLALNAVELGIDMELFIRKNKDDKSSKEFYYLGKIHATGNVNEITMPNTNKKAVEIEYRLLTPIRPDLYDYLTN